MAQFMPPTQHIPVNVQQAAEAHQLGTPVAAFNKASLRPFVGGAVILLLFFGVPFYSLISSLSHPDPYQYGTPPLGFYLFVFALVFAAVGFLFYYYRLRGIYVYSGGLIYRTWFLNHILRWEQVSFVTRKFPARRSVNLFMRSSKGRTLTLPLSFNYNKCLQACDVVEREYARAHGIGVGGGFHAMLGPLDPPLPQRPSNE